MVLCLQYPVISSTQQIADVSLLALVHFTWKIDSLFHQRRDGDTSVKLREPIIMWSHNC